ncbi:MAG TPA: YqiA/YcfP family alpha/beta fold hydrolase [Myxococcaceae bacterium]|nr:YqiA/YcfP family alpha/beta fold hydrolase [Myxococcaceae bacterium]
MFLYLHGFASSPQSRKAQRFLEHFQARGATLEIPALDEGDFEHLTLSRQLRLVERLLADAPRPHVIIGSSMGGYLALLHAQTHPIDALVVMAPAVDFATRWSTRFPAEDIAAWERTGSTLVDHHALGRKVPLSFELVRDSRLHPAWPRVEAPALVLQGTRDDVVSPESVQTWVEQTPSARLLTYDTDHEMSEVVDDMAQEALRFLASVPSVAPQLQRAADDA